VKKVSSTLDEVLSEHENKEELIRKIKQEISKKHDELKGKSKYDVELPEEEEDET
jgi:hypothetical protein